MTSTRLRLLAVLGLGVALAGPAGAAERKIPYLTFDTPASGWAEKQVSDGFILQRMFTYGERKGGALIVLSGRPFSGNFVQAFTDIVKSPEQVKDEKPWRDEHGMTTAGFPMRWTLKCCGDGDVHVAATTVAFQPDGSLIYAQLIEMNLGDDDQDGVEAEFAQIVSTFDFAGNGRLPALPAPQPGGDLLQGLFLNVAGRIQPNPFGGTDYVVDMNLYYFEPGGLFSSEPPSGASTLEAFCPPKPDSCGTYELKGGQITLHDVSDRYGLVEVETTSFARDGEGLKIGGADFRPVKPLPDLQLDGSWTYFWASSGTTATSSGGVSTSRTIVFSPDGRFRRSGFSGATTSTEAGDTRAGTASGHEKPEETGTYVIDGYTLTLTLDGAKPELLSIYAPDGDDRDLLVIDGNSYLRDGRD